MQPVLNSVNVSCSCGNSFSIMTTLKDNLNIEACQKCHPAYTGVRRVMMTGATERFSKKYAAYSTKLTSSTGDAKSSK